MKTRHYGCAALALALVVGPRVAKAQVEMEGSSTTRERSSVVRVTEVDGESFTAEFGDDLLTALVGEGQIPRIQVRPPHNLGYLIRPRTHFVPELLKSVEFM